MINYYEKFPTEAEAAAFVEGINHNYPRWGYGTSLRIHENKEEGCWYVTGYRYSSCD